MGTLRTHQQQQVGQNTRMNIEDAPLLGVDDLAPVDLEALEAALAMLDDCDPCSPIDSSVAISTALSLDVSREVHASGATNKDGGTMITSSSDKRPRKRVREYSPEAERMRRHRKRLERQELERQAQQLERQLAAMKTRGRGLQVGPTGSETTLDAACERRQSQVHAEELNRRLRATLSAHVDVSKCVRRLVSQLSKTTDEVVKEVGVGVEAGKADQPEHAQTLARHSALFSVSSPHAHLAHTARSIQKTSRSVMDSVFESASSLELAKTTRVRPLDGGSGTCVEVTLTTPLNCELQVGIKLIRDWIVAKRYRNIHAVSYSSLAVQHDDRVTEARSNVTFEGLIDPTPWHCVSISDGHEDADRFEMVGTMLTAHPSGSVRFREEAWTLVTRSPIDPLHKTVVRMCYRLTTELDPDVGAFVDGTDATKRTGKQSGESFQRNAQRRLIERKTTKMADLQRTLLRETGQEDLGFLAGA